MDELVNELTALTSLQLSILNDGKIKGWEDERMKTLGDIQEKYSYGWNIWEEDMIQQIKQIDLFKVFISEVYSRKQ